MNRLDHNADSVLRHLAAIADRHDEAVKAAGKQGKFVLVSDMLVPLRICRLAQQWRDESKAQE